MKAHIRPMITPTVKALYTSKLEVAFILPSMKRSLSTITPYPSLYYLLSGGPAGDGKPRLAAPIRHRRSLYRRLFRARVPHGSHLRATSCLGRKGSRWVLLPAGAEGVSSPCRRALRCSCPEPLQPQRDLRRATQLACLPQPGPP